MVYLFNQVHEILTLDPYTFGDSLKTLGIQSVTRCWLYIVRMYTDLRDF